MIKHRSAFVLLAAILAVGCEREPAAIPEAANLEAPVRPQSSSDNVRAEVALDATRVAEITDYPQKFDGQRIQVRSDLERVESDWSFVLDEARALAESKLDNDVLIVGAQPLATWGIDRSWEEAKVIVVGTVRILSLEQLQTELGEKIGEETMKRYANRPIIIASSVKRDDTAS